MITGLGYRLWYWNRDLQQWRMDEVDQIDLVNETVVVLGSTVVDLVEAHLMRWTTQTDLNGKRVYEGDLMFSRAHLDKYKANGIYSWGAISDHIAQVVWNKYNGWVLQDLEEEDVFPVGAFDTVVGNEFQGILKEVDARVVV